jgi:hypothetical protein
MGMWNHLFKCWCRMVNEIPELVLTVVEPRSKDCEFCCLMNLHWKWP